VSFALLMGSVPFHVWMPSVASDSEPLASAFVFTINHGAIWFLLLAFLETYPGLSGYPGFGPLVSGIGLAMASVGGVLAASQRRPGRLMGYGALIDSGVALAALAIGTEQGLALAMLSLLVRPFGLALMAAGLRGLRRIVSDDLTLDAIRGLGRRAPWSTFAFVVGGLSTAGLPVTAGFAGRWSLYRAVSSSDATSVLTLMVGSVGLMVGVWRALSALLDPMNPLGGAPEAGEPNSAEGWPRALVVLVVALASMVVGLNPQLLAQTAAQLAGLYSFFAP